jgi:hypothetical protein
MPLTPLDIPAGIYRNGTDLQSSNRWRDANLVRWIDGTMRPVGGWRLKSDNAADNSVRGMLTWKDNSNSRYIAGGSYSSLYIWNQGGVRYDITPAGFNAGRESASAYTGYGAASYGFDTYGTERLDNQTILPATTWSLDNWGEYLVGCTRDDGRVYEWQLNSGTPAAVVANAPTSNVALMVTLRSGSCSVLGAGGNPRLVQVVRQGRQHYLDAICY